MENLGSFLNCDKYISAFFTCIHTFGHPGVRECAMFNGSLMVDDRFCFAVDDIQSNLLQDQYIYS